MVLESTMVCVDNSEYMRNGDFAPTRLQAQQDAVNIVCQSKTRANPENNVGILTMANTEVLVTLTTDVGKILAKLHQVTPNGTSNFVAAIRIAHLALKHRQGRNHRMKIVAFVGSPVEAEEKDIVRLAKRLKKEKVQVDIINFGEEAANSPLLNAFIDTLNASKDGAGSHLVTVLPGPHLSDALILSPIVQGEDGTGAPTSGFEFGVDPNEDPELALALRVSMEEQRRRQEEESRRAQSDSAPQPTAKQPATTEEALLEQALAMSLSSNKDDEKAPQPTIPDFSSMSEEEQIAYAMQMSMQDAQAEAEKSESPMEVDEETPKKEGEEDYTTVMDDLEFLQSVLENLPGVNPREAVRSAVGSLQKKKDGDNKEKDSDNKEKDSEKKKEDEKE